MTTAINLAVLRTIASELAQQQYGSAELTPQGLLIQIRLGCNGRTISARKLVSWQCLEGLTIGGAKQVVKMVRDDLIYSSEEDEEV